MAKNQTLRELMIDELRDLYDAERQLVKALPKMAKGATSDELRGLIESHLEETQEHVRRLEQAFELLEGPMRERGAAIMHDLAVYAAKGSPAQRRAEAFLGSPRFMATAAPALQLAVALRRARSCADVRALLPEVKATGDKSALAYLKFFNEHLASYPCLRTDSLLADTTKVIELRAKQ